MINRRSFLITTVSAICVASTSAGATLKFPTYTKIDLWETKIDTLLQMTADYGFTTRQTNAMFGYHFEDRSSQELREMLLGPVRGSSDTIQRVHSALTVHTWIRGGVGTDISLQIKELERHRVIKKHPVSGQRPEQSLGTMLRNGFLADLSLAADFCSKTPLVVANYVISSPAVAPTIF